MKKITELEGHQAALYTLAEGFSGHEILSAGSERFVANWDLNKSDLAEVIAKANGVIYSLLPIPEFGLLLLGNDQGGIHVVDMAKKQELRYLLAHKAGIFDLSLQKDKGIIYACGGDGLLSVWDLKSFECMQTIACGSGKLRQMALSPKGDLLAIACGDNQIRLLDTETNQIINSWKAHEMSVNSVCFSPSGDVLLSGGKDAYLNVWNVNTQEKLKSIPAHNFAIYSIVFHPEGNLFATGSRDKTVKIWDAENFEFLLRIDKEMFGGHSHSVNKLIWLKEKQLLISAGDDRRIIVWEVN
ncbi:MAG: WD40 repeat domain-containing protein [Bacteroidia bacterium]